MTAHQAHQSRAQQHLVPRASEVFALEQQGYFIGKKIGEGSYASVHTANYVHRNKTKVRLGVPEFLAPAKLRVGRPATRACTADCLQAPRGGVRTCF